MKLYIVTGEPSGDLHAANLVHKLKIYNSILKIRAWGGERLIAEGVEIAKHIKDTAFMGLWNVLKNLNIIKYNYKAFTCLVNFDFKLDALFL